MTDTPVCSMLTTIYTWVFPRKEIETNMFQYTQYNQATAANELAEFSEWYVGVLEGYNPLALDTLMRFPSLVKAVDQMEIWWPKVMYSFLD